MDETRYWPFYCEENVWHLCAAPRFAGRDVWVALISNPARRVAIWAQRSAEKGETVPLRGDLSVPVNWNYHVILIAAAQGGGYEVWDLDTIQGAPVDAGRYLDVSFAGTPWSPTEYAPRFRLLDAAEFRRTLATDRRHMRRPDGSWTEPPPPWPTIGEGSNLERLIDMDDDFVGEVLDLEGLRRRLS